FFFFFQAEDGIRDDLVTGVQTCALPILRGPDTREIGRGLVAYDAEDAEKIKGRSSPDVMAILGISGRAEMIHRDDLVVGPHGARSEERRVGKERGCRWTAAEQETERTR